MFYSLTPNAMQWLMRNIFMHTILHTSVNISAYSDNHIMTCSCLNLEYNRKTFSVVWETSDICSHRRLVKLLLTIHIWWNHTVFWFLFLRERLFCNLREKKKQKTIVIVSGVLVYIASGRSDMPLLNMQRRTQTQWDDWIICCCCWFCTRGNSIT